MLFEQDVSVASGRVIHTYDSGPAFGAPLVTVFWQHGTPQSGFPPPPLVAVAAEKGVRWLAMDRPGYGASTPMQARDVAAVAADVSAVADALGVDRFAMLGASGGGPHALACAALLPDRVVAAACIATVAPFDAAGLDWFAGMAKSGATDFRAAVDGRAALADYVREHALDPPATDLYAPQDLLAFRGPYWPWLEESAQAWVAGGTAGLVDDLLAFVRPWGFHASDVHVPVLLMHGEQDRAAPPEHSRWLAHHLPHAELQMSPEDGHLSIFNHSAAAVEWLARNWDAPVGELR